MNSSQDGVMSSQAEALFCSEITVVTGKKEKKNRKKMKTQNSLPHLNKKHIPASVTKRKASAVCVLLPGLG